ncbi:hypothetical protein ACFLXX_05295 [Chloroflexota bacterium]
MGTLAWVFGILGGLCAVMGIITAAEVIPTLGAGYTTMFWLTLGVILLLASIAFTISRSGYE